MSSQSNSNAIQLLVRDFLERHYEREYLANEIADKTRLSLGITKGALRSLYNRGEIEKRLFPNRPTKYFYRAKRIR